MPDLPAWFDGLRQKAAAWILAELKAGRDAFIPFVPALAAIAAFLLALVAVGVVVRIRRDRVFHGATLRLIDAMDGSGFEEFLTQLFSHLGYHVQSVGGSHDFGADLILVSHRQRIVVQAKRYSGSVGIAAVQEVLGAVRYYHGTRGMVVTNSVFTGSARELAARSGIELWDRRRLAAAMSGFAVQGRRNRHILHMRSEP